MLDIAFAEPATSGFRWKLAAPPAGCTVAGDASAPADPAHPGRAGGHRWQVTVDAPGRHTLVFTLGRGWEETPRQSVAITVSVR